MNAPRLAKFRQGECNIYVTADIETGSHAVDPHSWKSRAKTSDVL